MARQEGPTTLRGTIQNITFYIMDGKGFARKKSSLDKKRFFKDSAFERSRKSCERMGRGSQLASVVYNGLPKVKRVAGLYSELRSLAIGLLKEGRSEDVVLAMLNRKLTVLQKASKRKRDRKKSEKPTLFTVLQLPKRWVPETYIEVLNEMIEDYRRKVGWVSNRSGEKSKHLVEV